jgi:hypothetical protein
MKKRPFTPRADAAERIASAKRLIRGLLALRHEVRDDQLRELLSVCLWKLTEAEPDHKHRTRFRSEAALRAHSRDLQHEHVFERGRLVEELLRHPDEVERVADLVVACTVTKAEHAALAAACRANPGLTGWDRYRAAGIRVLDVATGLEHRTA